MKKYIVALLILFNFVSNAQIDRVEPPFWWSDMNLSEVQIMFYGKNIAQNEVAVSSGLVIKTIQKTENPNYLFVTVDTKNVAAQDFVFTFKILHFNFLIKFKLIYAFLLYPILSINLY